MSKKKDSFDIALEFAINLENDEPKHYERIPAILDYLTYIKRTKNKDGSITYERKRLDVYAKELYRILKRSAGNTACWKGRDALAYEVNCSTGKITDSKNCLSESFEQLNGKSLINIEEKRMYTTIDNKIINKKPIHVITLHNIWNFNNAFIGSQKDVEPLKLGVLSQKEAEIAIEKMYQTQNVHKSGAPSPHDYVGGASAPNDNATQRAESPHDINHTPYSQTPFQCLSYPDANASQLCLLNKDEGSMRMNSEIDAVQWLVDFGINNKVAGEIVHRMKFPHVKRKIIEFMRTWRDLKITKSLTGKLISILNKE
jgi:hypothetical protein